MSFRILPCIVAAAVSAAAAQEPPPGSPWTHEELRRIPAAEARQGVASDGVHLYAIDNRAIGKYRIDTGERAGGWLGSKDGPLTHLNAGVVLDGRLYCAHSNFPGVPTISSVEIWDTKDLKHIGTQSFGIFTGSLTWVDRKDNQWFACFAQYAKTGADPGKNPAFTQLIKFDDQWRRLEGWVFPKNLVLRFGNYSSSGGAFGPGGGLFVTGHDARELYTLDFPEAGSELRWTGTIPISAAGQAFCWDPVNKDTFYSIARATKEIIISRLLPPGK